MKEALPNSGLKLNKWLPEHIIQGLGASKAGLPAAGWNYVNQHGFLYQVWRNAAYAMEPDYTKPGRRQRQCIDAWQRGSRNALRRPFAGQKKNLQRKTLFGASEVHEGGVNEDHAVAG